MTFESIDTYDISITNAIKSHYKDIIHNIGENQNREGLLDTRCILLLQKLPYDKRLSIYTSRILRNCQLGGFSACAAL